jgi:hypothetical protein
MDGVKRRLGQSLQLRLSIWLAIAVLLSAVAAGVFSFKAAFHEANEIQDLQLKEVAAIVTVDNVQFMEEGSMHYVPDFKAEAKVVVQRLSNRSVQGWVDLPLPRAMSPISPGCALCLTPLSAEKPSTAVGTLKTTSFALGGSQEPNTVLEQSTCGSQLTAR